MFSFLSEFTRDPNSTYTILVMDEDGIEQPRPYRVRPKRLMLWWVGTTLGLALALLALVGETRPPEPALAVSGELSEVTADPLSEDWTDHAQPALSLERLPADGVSAVATVSTAGERYLTRLRFPVLPPVNGILTRGFDARIGHYAIDIAAEEGSVVRAVGDGHVILADWTHEGGFTMVIQHADGYVSVYKHNQRLLKRVGDRVRDREAIALSGNSGEITTGPHLHFELWHNGLAQDPRLYFIGL